MPGSAVFTIISSVTRALVCASAGIENSVARKMPAAGIRYFNDASLVFFVFVVLQRRGNCSDASVSALAGAARTCVTRLKVLFTINIHNIIIVQQRSFSWLAETEALPCAGPKT